MGRKVFFSFHYAADNWRVSQVRQMGAIEGDAPLSDNAWEKITAGGDLAIQRWIDAQMADKTCLVVLIGAGTAGRRWVTYEINKAWNDGKGVLGVYIHALKDTSQLQASKGGNPFGFVTFTNTGKPLSSVVSTYDPPYTDSTKAYAWIRDNIAAWVETAIKQRASFK